MSELWEAYGKCVECGDVCWTDFSPLDQAVICSCGKLEIRNFDIVRGECDPAWSDSEMIAYIDAGNR